jgi:fructokinase
MILVAGEALIDFFPGAHTPGRSVDFTGLPGGSPLNVAVGLSRLGVRASFFSKLSTDAFGHFLVEHLVQERVDLGYLLRSERPSTLSFVSMGADGVPSYVFLGENAADVSIEPSETPVAFPSDITAFHFGSFSLAVGRSAHAYQALVRREGRSRVVAIDINVRPRLVPDLVAYRSEFELLLPQISLLKASAEDIHHLYGTDDLHAVARRWRALGALLVLVTDGERGAYSLQQEWRSHAAVPVSVVDTVGAGDSFHAATLAELSRHGLLSRRALARIPDDVIDRTLRRATRAASLTCSRRGANLPLASELDDEDI